MRKSERNYAIVTGASGNIGSKIVAELISNGWFVCMLDIQADALELLGERLPPDRILVRTLDVCSAAEWSSAATEIAAWTGGQLDLLVNNAAVLPIRPEPLREMNLDQVRRIIDVNLMGVITGIMTCLPMLEATPGAKIVNISSISAGHGWPNASIYSVSKAAIRNLTEALAIELAPHDISVSDITPGFVDGAYFVNDPAGASARAHLLRWGVHFGKPEHVALAVVDATHRYRRHRSVGYQASAFSLLIRFCPALSRWVCRKLSEGALYSTRSGTS